MKKYYLIESKSDDYNACNMAVIYTEEEFIKNYVYYYTEIPKEHYDVLKEYLNDITEWEVDENYLYEYF